jgi:hypothetical protein
MSIRVDILFCEHCKINYLKGNTSEKGRRRDRSSSSVCDKCAFSEYPE